MKRLLLTLLALTLASCSSTAKQRACYLEPFYAGELKIAACEAERQLPKSSHNVCLTLDRAQIALIDGDFETAKRNFLSAIDSIERFNLSCPAENVLQFALHDEASSCPGDDFEQILARLYLAFTLDLMGDSSGFLALLRQAEEAQLKKEFLYKSSRLTENFFLYQNPLAKFLLAAALEKKGETGNARALYKQAGIPVLGPAEGSATVIVLCHSGNVPIKVSRLYPASAAALYFDAAFQPRISSLTGIPAPVLVQPHLGQALCASANGVPLQPVLPIAWIAREELHRKIPAIVGRGLLRYAARRSCVEAADAQDPLFGALADLAVTIANSQTRADERCWSTLPHEISLARFDLPPGRHEMTLACGGEKPVTAQLELPKNALCVLHLFHLHPGQTKVLIPTRFLGDPL
ncbi:MAG: hypothetical protein KDK48_04335 [Chlamydiia bacterium]|nr:hypothetical protein [Chlamydiia bacterium]